MPPPHLDHALVTMMEGVPMLNAETGGAAHTAVAAGAVVPGWDVASGQSIQRLLRPGNRGDGKPFLMSMTDGSVHDRPCLCARLRNLGVPAKLWA